MRHHKIPAHKHERGCVAELHASNLPLAPHRIQRQSINAVTSRYLGDPKAAWREAFGLITLGRTPHPSRSEVITMKIEGGCHCGKIAYEAEIDPDTVWICHCRDCQSLTGTAYRAVVQTPAASFRILRGQPRTYIKTADSGIKRAHHFCADCGSPIYGSAVGDSPTYSLRIGTIEQRPALRPVRQIWRRSALPWAMNLTSIESLDRQ